MNCEKRRKFLQYDTYNQMSHKENELNENITYEFVKLFESGYICMKSKDDEIKYFL